MCLIGHLIHLASGAAPDAVSIVNVSRADYSFFDINTTKANNNGVYPTKISWQQPNENIPYGYIVYRSDKPDSGFKKISNKIIVNNESENIYIDDDKTLQIGKAYFYRILSVDDKGFGNKYSVPVYGWGALTHEKYLIEFNKTIVSSQKKLTLMHKPNPMSKLGNETKNGNISGSIYYNATFSGTAIIIMKYTDYVDYLIPLLEEPIPIFNLNGNSNTSADVKQNGSMNGTIKCTGMYPGSVSYDKITIGGGVAAGGTYGVSPEGCSISKELDFNLI